MPSYGQAQPKMMSSGSFCFCILAFLSLREVNAQGFPDVLGQPNPPVWPQSVQVFGPRDKPEEIEAAMNEAFGKNGGQMPTNHGEFSQNRFAFFFEPGTYEVDVPVGFYTQVLGLGNTPDDVIFDSKRGIYCEEGNKRDIFGSLSTFWRGAENFRTLSNMLWATSQATPIRRAIVDGDLVLAEYHSGIGMGYSSGGFIGNVHVKGTMQASSQQQYCTRNAVLEGGLSGGVWNMVFVGTEGAPDSQCGRSNNTAGIVSVDATPVIAEKPFISISENGMYYLNIPDAKTDRIGTDFGRGLVVDFKQVYVARDTDKAAAINAKLQQGFHVVLTPGVYHLEAPLELAVKNQVLLGIGFATLVSAAGTAVVRVGQVDGVRVAGLLLEAGTEATDVLLQWGDGSHSGSAENPGFLHDIFVRVGGTNDPMVAEAKARVMVRIEAGHVVGDNLWLWRADHSVYGITQHGQNPSENGLVVTGSDVTMYGLAVEHTLGDQLQWSGENGRTYFYQCETPYDVTKAFGEAGFAGYRVNDTVRAHRAWGVGVYHYFRDYTVKMTSGIVAPPWLANSFESPLAVCLDGYGEMGHILNHRGGMTRKDKTQAQWSCKKGPYVPYKPPTTTSTSSTSTSTTSTTSTWTGTSTTRTSTSTTTTTTTFAWWQTIGSSTGGGSYMVWWALAFSSCLVCAMLAYAFRRHHLLEGFRDSLGRLLALFSRPDKEIQDAVRKLDFSPQGSPERESLSWSRVQTLLGSCSPGRDSARTILMSSPTQAQGSSGVVTMSEVSPWSPSEV